MIAPAKLTRALAQANAWVESCREDLARFQDPARRPQYMIQRELNAEIEGLEQRLRGLKRRARRIQKIIWKARQDSILRSLPDAD